MRLIFCALAQPSRGPGRPIETLTPIQAEYQRIISDKPALQAILDRNALEAARRANRTLDKVKRKVGFAPRSKG